MDLPKLTHLLQFQRRKRQSLALTESITIAFLGKAAVARGLDPRGRRESWRAQNEHDSDSTSRAQNWAKSSPPAPSGCQPADQEPRASVRRKSRRREVRGTSSTGATRSH